MSRSAAAHLAPLVDQLLGPEPPLRLSFWDGSAIGPDDAAVRLAMTSPTALRRLRWAPGALGLSRAYVAGELRIEEGSVFDLLDLRTLILARDPDVSLELGAAGWRRLARAAVDLGLVGLPPAPPPEEAGLHGRLRSRGRDRAAIGHHYDVGNDFYRLVLGPSMTYSCAVFPDPGTTLEEAQDAKHELVCRKLGLGTGMRLLDVGCGWGGLAIHAATRHGARVLGITLSAQQAARARQRVEAAGVADRVEIRLLDYRDLRGVEQFDAIASVGMFEHVGPSGLASYTAVLKDLLRPEGRLLNHAISRTRGDDPLNPKSFVARYVFPDGELVEVGRVVSAMQDAGLECRDVESLREHYGRTLRAWVANLEERWEEAVALVGAARARIWLLYMAGSAIAFEGNRLNVHQVLLTRTTEEGTSGMPATRGAYGVLADR